MLQELADTLSAPRRYLWDLLGAEGRSGKDLISDWTGLDKNSWITGGLGAGLEMVGDPLSYAIPFGAGALTKALKGLSPALRTAENLNAAKNLGMTGEEIYRYMPKPVSRFLGS